ncbi:MAG: chemotaxis protein CheW [Candidatus Heimdallarchaeota archaeon]
MTESANKSISSFDAKDESRYVVFKLGTEKFGARIEQIKEVLTVDHITSIPKAPDYVLGVINMRGVVCTVIDLPRRLTIRRAASDETPNLDSRVVVIVEIGKTSLGMAVDQVESITSIPYDIIETQLDMVKKEINAPFLEGIAKILDDELIILLNLDVVFSEYEVDELANLAGPTSERSSELDEEFIISKEELDRLDLAHDDIDVLSSKSKKTESEVGASESTNSQSEVQPEKGAKFAESKTDFDSDKSVLEKKNKGELVKLAVDLGIDNPKAKKKAELVQLLMKKSTEA